MAQSVIACLGPAPTPVDEVVRRCHVSPADVAALLLELSWRDASNGTGATACR